METATPRRAALDEKGHAARGTFASIVNAIVLPDLVSKFLVRRVTS